VVSGPVLRLSEFTFGRPYHAAHLRLGPRDARGFHTHKDFYEVFYVLAGKGEHRTSSGTQVVQTGDLVLVRPTDFHYIVGSPGSGIECINIALPSEVWEGMLDVAEVAAAGDWLKSQLPRLVRLPVDAANRAESIFRGAVERYALVQDRLDLLRLVLDVLELLTDPSEVGQGSLRPSWLVRACTAMRREENLRGGVPRLVELAGVSHGHLCHAMRSHYGTTPTALVSELRLRHAETLICTTSLSLSEIASRCGFASLSYFSKVFRSAHEASPREFRRVARKNAPI
jgi:AraC-like DNA-binding protein/mannose-6-phosphate isomerase-like protein (cupin superfamily)